MGENWRRERLKMSPTEIIEKRKRDLKSDDPEEFSFFERMVIRFKNALSEHHYDKDTILSILGRVQSFFAHNWMKLNFPRGALKVEESEVIKHHRRQKWIPTNIDIRLMYDVADLEDRALLLVLYQLGLSPIDASKLRIEQLPINEETSETDFIYFELLREKTGVLTRTALNPELIHDLKALLRSRGWPKEGWVFESSKGNRLEVQYINERMKNLVRKALGEEKAKVFKAKNLRDAFNEALLEANLNGELKDCLFGHVRKGAKEHYSVSRKAIVEAYKKVFPLISINEFKQAMKDKEMLEKAIEDLSEKLTALETQNRVLREKLNNMEPFIKEFMKALENPHVRESFLKWLRSLSGEP